MTTLPLICPLCSGQDTVFYLKDNKNFQHQYQRCQHCDLVFVVPDCRLNAEAEKARYDMHHNDDSEHYVNFLSRLSQPLLTNLSKASVGLDFGSGCSQAMANLFRKQGHECHCYDIFYYPDKALLNKQYDFIVASEVIEHLYHPQQVVEQWMAMLNPNGLLGIMTGIRPADEDFSNWWYKNDPTHVSLFSQQTFDYLASEYSLVQLYQSDNVRVYKNSR